MDDRRGLGWRQKGDQCPVDLSAFFSFSTPARRDLLKASFIGPFSSPFSLSSACSCIPCGAEAACGPSGSSSMRAWRWSAVVSCSYVIANYELIMGSLGLPMAQTRDILMTACLVVIILEISRRAIGLIFPLIVVTILVYALFGEYIPGRLGHRGFDIYFLTETLFLSDLGIWGMLTGVAATVIAAFTVFGSVLLNTGGGRTFIDIAMRLGGRAPVGAPRSRRSPRGSSAWSAAAPLPMWPRPGTSPFP